MTSVSVQVHLGNFNKMGKYSKRVYATSCDFRFCDQNFFVDLFHGNSNSSHAERQLCLDYKIV